MNPSIIQQIDAEIARLQEARALLAEIETPTIGAAPKKKRGRPAKTAVTPPRPKKRVLSAEARAKIAAAQRARWAAKKQ